MPRQGFSAPTLLGDMLLTMVEDLFTPLTTRQDLMNFTKLDEQWHGLRPIQKQWRKN